jgi:hypothetical protein
MNNALDPWNDASVLAQRLSQPDAALFIIVGAEQWCEKCRNLRPHFDAYLGQADSHDVWLWLDLEDHAEFLGDYQPDTLPMLLAYRGSHMIAATALEQATAQDLLQAVVQIKSGGYKRVSQTEDPGIWARLLVQDWASDSRYE